MEPETIERIERIGPDKNLVDLTKEILNQNKMILEANTYLLKIIVSPYVILKQGEVK